MPNVAASISSHNKNILNEKSALALGGCNCSGDICPLDGKCLTGNLLYEAEITADINNYGEKLYKGVTEPEWKKRFGNHKKSFEDKKYSDDTELSKEVWRIKKKRRNFSVKWRILKQHRAYDPVSRRCVLCLKEKLAILEHDGANLLNKRSEIIGTCRHRRKYMLSSYDVK